MATSASTPTSTRPPNSVFPVKQSGHRIWPEDEATFSMDKTCAIKHDFHQHPLMQLDELEKLANKLMPLGGCRFIEPGTKIKSAFKHGDKHPDGREISEVFRRLEEPGSWIALYNVERDPAYAKFVQDALESVKHLIDRQEPGMFNAQGFMFISAPPSVTPFHIDRENNFWLQIRGHKTMSVWNADNRHVVSGEHVERFIVTKSLEHVKLNDAYRPFALERDFAPGDGVYFPSTAPHATTSEASWVTPGDGISISIGIVFYTSVTQKHANIHAWNRVLRKIGMNPKFPGASALDAIKYPLGKAFVTTKKLLRGYEPPTGF
ncbi:MAG TPA: cupin domain-containing protein [Gemmatimonadaceae bacterium]|jgi:hypothetical protein